MSHSSNHFLTLDATKKPTVRKGVNFQSYIPPVLPGGKQPPSRSAQLNKVHVAIDTRVGSTLERVTKTLPDMGPFNVIAQELAVEFLEAQAQAMKDDVDSGSKPSTYWDAFEESLDKMVKQEIVDDRAPRASSFSLDTLRTLLSRLESWNERSIKATLGTGQVLSTEVDELLEEARIIEQRVELPVEVLNKLRVLQKVGETFANKVRSKLTLKGKEKVPLRVLTELMKEAEALPIETEEVRFFRNQRGRIQALCHSAQKASRDKSLEKSKDVTIEAAEIRAILPDLDFVQTQVSMAEWVQKAMAKTDKKSSVPLQTIEQLFEDPSAALIKAEDCEIMQILQKAMNEGRAWQNSANKILAGIQQSKTTKQMPTVEVLQALLDEHAKLNKVSVPLVSSNIEGLLRRAKAWMKKQERTLSGTWSLVDAKSLMEEGKQLSSQVDLNPQFGDLVQEVEKAEAWCSRARLLLASLALTDIDQLEPLVNSSFKAPAVADLSNENQEGPITKRLRTTGYGDRLSLNSRELQALKNYESSLADLTATIAAVEPWLVPLLSSEKLPKQQDLLLLRESLGIVRDLSLEEDVNRLCEGTLKWNDRAEAVLGSPFPRPAGVLRSLATLVHELAANPMRYDHWKPILEAAKMEVWAHQVRYVQIPMDEASIDLLVSSCPFPLNTDEENKFEEREIAGRVTEWQNEWMRQVLGLERRSDERGDEMTVVRYAQIARQSKVKACNDLLVPRRNPMHSRSEAEQFLSDLQNGKIVHLQSLITRIEIALNRNSALEEASENLAERLALDFRGEYQPDLFQDLLALLESVEQADLKVSHFDRVFTPIVGRLLQFQANVRALFRWDHDETVTEAGFRPSLEEVEQMWRSICMEAEQQLKLSQSFLKSVAYIASAFAVIESAHSWRSDLKELVGRLTVVNGERIPINLLRRHVFQWGKLQAITPYMDIVSDSDVEAVDRWEQQVSQVINRSKQRPRALLGEAEELLKSAPSPLGVYSQDFEILASHVEIAQKIRNASFHTISQSFLARSQSAGTDSDSFIAELTNLSKESRASLVDSGVFLLLETELRILRIEAIFKNVLGRPHVVPLEFLVVFIDQTALYCNAIESSWEHPEDRSMHLKGVVFFPNQTLVDACRTKITKTIKWRHFSSDFLSHLPPHHEALLAATPGSGSRKNASNFDQPPPQDLNQLEAMINAALGAPPTAAGEKILDIVLRNLEKDLPPMDYNPDKPKPASPEYVYPLPLYQLPPSAPSTPVPGAAQPSKRGSSKNSANQAAVPPENPLLLKGLSPMHQLLYQVPWVRPGMGYLSPLNEVMLRRPPEWVSAERERFLRKISRPGLPLKSALEFLVEHKRASLFQTTEYVRMRSFAATALRTVRTCMNKFSFLAARNKHEETDVPVEHWERILQPTASGGEGLDEGSVSGPPAAPSAQKENEEVELVGLLLQLEALAFQVPTKFRLLMLMLDMYDWRVKSQCVCHHMSKNGRPRPWTGDERALSHWATAPALVDIFAQRPAPPYIPGSDPLSLYVVPAPPPKPYVLCSMHMSFYYVIECCRHFIRVMSDMCELCYNVTTTDQEDMFWISCDACDKWFHGRCAGVSQQASSFTCPHCTLSSELASQEKKRLAMSVLQALPAKKFQPVDSSVRTEEAGKLLNEAKQQQIIVTCNPVELGIFKRLVPDRS